MKKLDPDTFFKVYLQFAFDKEVIVDTEHVKEFKDWLSNHAS